MNNNFNKSDFLNGITDQFQNASIDKYNLIFGE